MWRRIYQTSLLLLLGLAVVPRVAAQIDRWGYWENGVSEAWWFSADEFTKVDADAAIAKWNQIGEELSVSPNDWAGDYFRGDSTHGTFLRLSGSGFVMVDVDKCAARVMKLSFGGLQATPEKILLQAEFTNPSKVSHPHSSGAPLSAFVRVKWRGMLLLIAENEMSNFGDYVANLGKYNYSEFGYFPEDAFFFKNTSGQAHNNGHPEVPKGYERFLKEPIKASITRVKSRTIKKEYSYENPDGTGTSYFHPVSLTVVTIDGGSDRGLKEGMFLHVISPDEGDSVRLLRVGRSTSTGVIIRDLIEGKELFLNESNEQRPSSKIRAGWQLTTSRLR